MNLQEKLISRSKWKRHGSNTVHHESVNVEKENLHYMGKYFGLRIIPEWNTHPSGKKVKPWSTTETHDELLLFPCPVPPKYICDLYVKWT